MKLLSPLFSVFHLSFFFFLSFNLQPLINNKARDSSPRDGFVRVEEVGFKDFCPATANSHARGLSFQAILSLRRFRLVARDLREIAQPFRRVTHAAGVGGEQQGRRAAGHPLGKQHARARACARYFDARYFDSLSAPQRGGGCVGLEIPPHDTAGMHYRCSRLRLDGVVGVRRQK